MKKDRFQVPNMLQLFWGDAGEFSEARSVATPLFSDDQIHQYVLELPSSARGPLRLDPGARPAYVEIHGIELVAALGHTGIDGEVVCRWSAARGDARLIAGSGITRLGGRAPYRFVCTDDDPQLLLDRVPNRDDARRWLVRVTLRASARMLEILTEEVGNLERQRARRHRRMIAREETTAQQSLPAPPASWRSEEEHLSERVTEQVRALQAHEHAVAALTSDLEQRRREFVETTRQMEEREELLAGIARSRDWRIVRRYRRLKDRVLRPVRLAADVWQALRRREYRPGLRPIHELRWLTDDGVWESTGQDPQFDLSGPWPRGWTEVTLDVDADVAVAGCARLYVDRGTGYSERDCYELGEGAGSWTQFVRLGPEVVGVRLDPCASPGRFRILALTLTSVTARRARAAPALPAEFPSLAGATPGRAISPAATSSIHVFLERTWKDRLKLFLSDPASALVFPAFPEPVVSIVIPTFNKAEYLLQCLESVLAHTSVPFEIIVVDDASQDETPELLDKLKNVTCVRNEKNLEFIRTCNRGIRLAKGRYLLLLNNDVTVTPSWLSTLVETMERDPRCGAVQGKLVRPEGTLQEAGSIIWWDGTIAGYGRDDDPSKPEYGYLREVDYCSAACLLVRAELVRELGGLDERYLPAFYEDADLCFGVRRLGYRVVFQPRVSVYHCEFGTRPAQRAQALCRANRPKFVDKWAAELERHHRQGDAVRARDRRDGKRILVMDDQIPAPYLGSGFPRAYRMLELLAESGFVITFVPLTSGTPHQPATDHLQQLGVEVFHGDRLRVEDLLRDRAGCYDVVLVSRPHNGAKVLPLARRYFPRATIVYDAEALFCLRDFRKAELDGHGVSEEDQTRLLRQELDIMKPADVVMTVSESERDIIVREGAHPNVVVWGHALDVHDPVTPFSRRRDLLFVGGFAGGHPPNTDAVVYFATTLLPRIRQRLPDARFVVVGTQPPDIIQDLASRHIVVAGYVEDLTEHYERCRVFVAPIRFGAGISLKLLEAMSYGLPAVVSPVGAAGLHLDDGREALIAQSGDQFVDKVVQLYEDESLWAALQGAGQDYIRRHCAPDVMRERLADVLSGRPGG